MIFFRVSVQYNMSDHVARVNKTSNFIGDVSDFREGHSKIVQLHP